jgi:hypothetical protein
VRRAGGARCAGSGGGTSARNFTINRFSRVETAGPRVYVHYVLDLAEIPTFQAGTIDAPVLARRIADGARLTVDGRRVRLVPVEWALAHPSGAGGLKTTRFEVILRGPRLRGRSEVAYRDRNYPDRIGWKEIVVATRRAGATSCARIPRICSRAHSRSHTSRPASSRSRDPSRGRM